MAADAVNEQAPTVAAARAMRPGETLSRRLTAWAFSVGAMLAATVLAVQMLFAYGTALDDAQARLDQIGASIVPSLTDSLWQVDRSRAELLVDGIARLPGVSSVVVSDSDGDDLRRGDPEQASIAERTYPLRHRLAHPSELGRLTVSIGAAGVFAQLANSVVAAAAVSVVALLGMALLMLRQFRRQVTRHLVAMAAHVARLGPESLGEPLVLQRRQRRVGDELDELADAFNRMQRGLHDEFELRKRREAELLQERKHLEDRVFERTQELARKNIELQRQNDAVEEIANTDSLTGIPNRRTLITAAEREFARASRHDEPCSLVLFDIDHFKQLNDRWGHAFGDRVLRTVCAIARRQLRAVDMIARWGGEEFAVLLGGIDRDGALQVAERVRQSLAGFTHEAPDGSEVQVTASFGVTTLAGGPVSLDDLVRRADLALYEAKHAGRNRVH